SPHFGIFVRFFFNLGVHHSRVVRLSEGFATANAGAFRLPPAAAAPVVPAVPSLQQAASTGFAAAQLQQLSTMFQKSQTLQDIVSASTIINGTLPNGVIMANETTAEIRIAHPISLNPACSSVTPTSSTSSSAPLFIPFRKDSIHWSLAGATEVATAGSSPD
ncbi:hypothetical protein PENTCL1PPCAC_14161, partial [Pristionchus entomophagus]